MPKVNGKSFPYTPAGMAAAEKAEYSSKTPNAMRKAVQEGMKQTKAIKDQSSQMKQNPAVKAVAAKKAALKKKAASSKPMSMKEAMKGVRVIPSTGVTPKKAMPSSAKKLGE